MKRDELWPHVNNWTLTVRRRGGEKVGVRLLWFGVRYATVSTIAGQMFQVSFSELEVSP